MQQNSQSGINFQQALSTLVEMFPGIDAEVIKTILIENNGQYETTIENLLIICESNSYKYPQQSLKSQQNNKPINQNVNLLEDSDVEADVDDEQDEISIQNKLQYQQNIANQPKQLGAINNSKQHVLFGIVDDDDDNDDDFINEFKQIEEQKRHQEQKDMQYAQQLQFQLDQEVQDQVEMESYMYQLQLKELKQQQKQNQQYLQQSKNNKPNIQNFDDVDDDLQQNTNKQSLEKKTFKQKATELKQKFLSLFQKKKKEDKKNDENYDVISFE